MLFHAYGGVIYLTTLRDCTGVYSTAYADISVYWIVVAHLCPAMKLECMKQDSALDSIIAYAVTSGDHNGK